MTKRRLGRGLGALIPSQETVDEATTGLRLVGIDAITPNPHQPRGQFNEEALQELANSIREHGLIQPLIVHDEGEGRYTLIAGERRWRAGKLAGLEEIPVLVKEASPQEMLELALIENIQRADLNPLEEALAYQQLVEDFGLTQANVAERVGKSRPTVANMLRLLNLPPNIQQAVTDNQISGGHARALLALPTPEAQTMVMNSIIKNSLSVRQTEALVNKILAGKRPEPKQKKRKKPEVASLEAQFRQSLGTRVDIQHGVRGGKVVIHYYSDEELQAIYDVIVERRE